MLILVRLIWYLLYWLTFYSSEPTVVGNRKFRPPEGLLWNAANSQRMHQRPKPKWHFCQLFIFSLYFRFLSATIFDCWLWIFASSLASKEELLNIQLMLMNSIPEHPRDRADSQRVSYGADNKVAKVIGNKQTTDTQLCRGVYIHRLRLRQDRYPRFSSMGGRTRNRTF